MTVTIQQLASDAICAMDGCNLSGIVHSYSRAMTALRELYPNRDTRFYNRHPIAVMYAEKCYDMTGCGQRFSEAYRYTSELATNDRPSAEVLEKVVEFCA